MALSVTLTGTTVTLDETAGLQNDDTNTALPSAFSSRLTALGADPATAINAAVSNGNVISISGVTGTVGISFTDANGGALNGDSSGLFTNDGEEIFLFTDTVNDNIVLGMTAAGAIAFAVFLEETGSPVSGGKFWSIQYEALEHTDATNADDSLDLGNNLKVAVNEEINFSFAGAPSGSNLFMTFGDPTSAQIVVIGENPLNQSQGGNITTKDVLNISQAGSTTSFGVNGNQLNDNANHPTEGAFITYVTGANTNFLVPNLDQNEADVEANIDFQNVFNATSASFTVNQTNPGVGPVTVKITAFSTAAEPGVNFVDGLTNDTHVNITSFSITDFVVKSGNTQFTPQASIDADGNLIVTGLSTGDKVQWTTSGTHDRVLIENISAHDVISGNDNNTFDIGGFSLSTTNAASAVVGTAVHFEDDGPTAAIVQGAPTVAHDETAGVQADADDTTAAAVVALFAGVSNVSTDLSPAGFAQDPNPVVSSTGSSFGTDSVGGTTAFSLAVSAAGVDSGLDTTDGTSIFLFKEGDLVVGRIGGAAGAAAFAVAINGTSGVVSVAQYASLKHPDATNPDDSISITDSALLAVVTVTDGDGDKATSSTGIGDAVQFQDDGPTITAPFDADPNTAGIQTPEQLGNAVGQTASGTFGYDIGSDDHLAAFYTAGGSDFVDTNGTLPAVQINLTGTVDNAQNPNITNANVTLTAESLTSASFDFSFNYDKDPITAGVQDATAGGTLVFDKVADTYTFTLTDEIDGFSFDVLHTNELVAKQPTGNTGQPLIVAEQLTPNGDPNPFFVQFTGNSITQQIGFGFNSTGDGAPVGDTTFNNGGATHDMVTNVNEDWVSATQATNGVAGDTIQKGELLTLRFFQENILGDVNPNAPGGGTERLDPTTSASGVVIKFDGIGASEDLALILDLKDANGNEVTRAVNVENSDLIKGNANVPPPYNTEFTLDNNDALLIIEQNDYTVAGETYQIQGIQIMQSANGLTGNAINLNGATGANGGSSATSNLTAWDPTDNDVLKIVDIGFVQQTTGTINANLDFSFRIVDVDGDTTSLQHLPVGVIHA